jgi:DNA helicase HerA-like ATPase
MNDKIIVIGDGMDIGAVEYASQGNAVLGIRDSGKSYTATLIAEQLLEARIPFVAFDPIGVWKYLKVGTPGRSGYQLVVAGEGGDIPLKPETAADIVSNGNRSRQICRKTGNGKAMEKTSDNNYPRTHRVPSYLRITSGYTRREILAGY